MNVKIFLHVIVLCSAIFAQKKELYFEHITSEDNLSSNTVLSIIQDSRGFLWVSTYGGGLNRYDGYKFTTYKNSPYDTTSISDNGIRAICEDRYGNIWVGTWGGGLNKFNRNTEKFKHFRNNPKNPFSVSSDLIQSLCLDKSGNLWIGTGDGGLDYFNTDEEKLINNYKHNPDDPGSISDNSIYSVYVDKKGNLWCGTAANGLIKFIEDKKQFIAYKHFDKDPESISGNLVVAICEDHLGNIWVGTDDGGLNKLDPAGSKFMHYTYGSKSQNNTGTNQVWAVIEDSDGLIWTGDYTTGLNIFDPVNEKFTSYRKIYNDPKSLNDDCLFTFCEDRSGVLWIGSWSGGLNKYDKGKQRFLNYSHVPNDNNSLSSNMVFAIYKDKAGILWIGTDDCGINRIDEKNNKYTRYRYDPDDLYSISGDNVTSICEDKEGNLWVSTGGMGLNKLNKMSGKFERYRHNPNNPGSISDDEISQVFCDSFGDLWIGTSGGGMDRLKKNEKVFIHYKNIPDDPLSICSKMIYSFYEDRSNNLWIGTYGDGLMLYDRKADHFIHYRKNPDDLLNSLSGNEISSICEDDAGILWIGTNDAGLNRFDRQKNHFKHFREKDGLANDMIYGVLRDDNGNLWISNGKGISRFNMKNETFKNYGEKDGLQGNEFNQWAYFKSSNGEMYFGGTNGLSVFHPDDIKDNPYIPPVVITDFQILHKPVVIGYDSLRGRTILDKSITETKQIELNHDDNIISFEFAALDYHTPEKNQYAYMLEGFDKNWIYSNADHRTITYTNLDPGEYTLRVKGSNNDGIWNEVGTSISIIILHPWWATTLAYVFYLIMIGSILYFTWRMQVKRIRIKHEFEMSRFEAEKLHEVDVIKSRFFANISHEFRTPLTLILGPAKDVIDKTKELETKQNVGLIKRNAGRLLGLVNQLLDLSKLEAGRMKLEAKEENIIPLLKGLLLSFSSLAERKKITLNFNAAEENIIVYLDRDKIEKIINNLLSNAFKFTPEGGKIEVTVGKLQKEVEIRISDNGIGIAKENIDRIFDRFYQIDDSHTRVHEGTGIGLALTKELIEFHKGKIKAESEEGKGTIFTISLLLGKEHLKPEEIIEENIEQKLEIAIKETESESETENRKEKTDIDLLLESDKPLLLVVEDNSDVRKYIISHLEKDYRIQEAIDGEDGMNEAFTHIPDLIISDVMMPKMDGFQMCKKLKTDERTSHIPIIILTAKAASRDKISGYEIGADDYIMKPFDAAELKVRVKNLIDIRKKLQEKFSSGDFAIPNELSSIDEQIMKRILASVGKHISEEKFSVEELSEEAAMSREHLYRKLKALTGKTPSLFIRSVRLTKARKLLKEKRSTISETAYSLGFGSPAYFTKCFKEEFGYLPSELTK